jgi:hypothetical protein
MKRSLIKLYALLVAITAVICTVLFYTIRNRRIIADALTPQLTFATWTDRLHTWAKGSLWIIGGTIVCIMLWWLIKRIRRAYRTRTPAVQTQSAARTGFFGPMTLTKLIWWPIGLFVLLLLVELVILIGSVTVQKYHVATDTTALPEGGRYDRYIEITREWSDSLTVPFAKHIEWEFRKQNVWLETELNDDPKLRFVQEPVGSARWQPVTLLGKLRSVRFRIIPKPGTIATEDWPPKKAVIAYRVYAKKK